MSGRPSILSLILSIGNNMNPETTVEEYRRIRQELWTKIHELEEANRRLREQLWHAHTAYNALADDVGSVGAWAAISDERLRLSQSWPRE